MSFPRTWQRFLRGHTLTETPGVREGWHRGRPRYHVLVLRVPDAAVQQRRAAVAAALTGWLLPSAPDDPHVTAWVYGFDAPAPHPLEGRTFPLQIGGANSFASCPFLAARCTALRAIRDAVPGRTLSPEERWAPWLPHLTVGRYAVAVAGRAVAARLRGLRGMPPISCAGRLVRCWVDPQDETGALHDT